VTAGAGGRVWRLGDDVDTDALAPGAYMKRPLAEAAAHCLETVAPRFAAEVRPGDVIVAGRRFGIGSSREQAVQVLRHLGVAAVLAESFGGIFHRNALNLGLPALECRDVARIADGDRVSVDVAHGRVTDQTTGETIACAPVPAFLLPMLEAGGLLPWLERRLARGVQP
jgi:3-isopropylmalate/(R)-2-methylmalate dehydratase small subunit